MVCRLLDRLDGWRHLPDYQLERRADIFFAVYLPGFLSWRMGVPIREELVPEFPLRLGTLYPSKRELNQSCKVDYLALSQDLSRGFLIELKTDGTSRREAQDEDLLAAKRVGLRELVPGVCRIVEASTHKHKYCWLLRVLERHGLIKLPEELGAALEDRRYASKVNACLPKIEVMVPEVVLEVVYVQPAAEREGEVGFEEFAGWLETLREDGVAARFAESLRRWAAELPGRGR